MFSVLMEVKKAVVAEVHTLFYLIQVYMRIRFRASFSSLFKLEFTQFTEQLLRGID